MAVDAVPAYCIHMHSSGLAHRTMGGRLVAITILSKSLAWLDPCGDFRVQKSLESWS